MTKTPEERFWSRVKKSDGCWEWTGAKTANGYGVVRRNKVLFYAHRVAYETIIGPISEGLSLDHLCRNPGCLNPSHLEPVTHAENVARGMALWAVMRRTGFCSKGHQQPLDDHSSASRRCRACALEYMRAYHKKHGPTHCHKGHPYSETAYLNTAGRRRCKVCRAERYANSLPRAPSILNEAEDAA